MTTRPLSQLIADLKATCVEGSDVWQVCEACSELRHALQLSTSNAEICNRVAREAKERCALLEEALRWALAALAERQEELKLAKEALWWAIDNSAGQGYSYEQFLRGNGCGCCSRAIEPPSHLEPIFRDVLGAKT